MASKKSSQRFFLIVSDSLKEHFSYYKWLYVFLLFLAILGLVLGVVSVSGRLEEVAFSDIPDTTLYNFVNKTISPFSLFFSRLFSFLGLFLLIMACGSAGFLCFIPVLVLFYRAVILATNCAILIHLYKIGGIFDVVLIFFPVHFVLLCVLLVWSVVCLKQGFMAKKTGTSIFSASFLLEHKAVIIVCLAAAFVAILLESLLLPCVSAVVFIGVS